MVATRSQYGESHDDLEVDRMNAKTLQQIFRLTTDGSFPAFLKITHPLITGGVLRLVNHRDDLVYDGEIYTAASFKFNPPKYSDKQIGNATITISCIDQTVIEIIRKIQTRASATVVAAFYFEGGDLSIDPIEEWSFDLSSVSWDGIYATWTMVFDDHMNDLVPCNTMSAMTCPGVA